MRSGWGVLSMKHKYGNKKYSHQFSLTIESDNQDGFQVKKALKKKLRNAQDLSLDDMWDNKTGKHYWL